MEAVPGEVLGRSLPVTGDWPETGVGGVRRVGVQFLVSGSQSPHLQNEQNNNDL